MPGIPVPYPTIPDERGDDLHGLEDLKRAELVIFMAGNQFMAMADLMAAFREAHPDIGPIYYETLLTTVHHRETPERILNGQADVGPVWATEIEHARRSGLPLEGVDVGVDLDQHDRVEYYACPLKNGRNQDNGRYFLEFLLSMEAQRIYHSYGFTPIKDTVN